ncbi:myosin-like coiled-coil protein-domain-containing protein [Microdochium bolleyi]|uniref:Myosin-like coiled-coil protein-domain-containing protein n=1 Tax=Microdochium bolleyi TaxID=196109 RepID=A0A136J833_9PEZI|nr:myosin-like coiled-coil protein-domain-containing protein [Microdochium bolleyi]
MATTNARQPSPAAASAAAMPAPTPLSSNSTSSSPALSGSIAPGHAHSDLGAGAAGAPLANGHHHHHHHHHHSHSSVHDPRLPPNPPAAAMAQNAAAGAASKKAKAKKAFDSSEASKLVAARISQLEVDTAAEKEQEAEIDREVRKANRELNHQMNKMSDLDKIDLLTKRSSELFANMKRLERDNIKNKKRADQLQKEKDTSRTDLSKQVGLKEKLEKLCRELQKENNKLKNEHRALNDTHDRLKTSSDDRFRKVLETLEGYQEEKDNPRKQVVYMKAEELFKSRFKSLIDQYELRELHFHSAMRTKEIEVQWNMARYEQQKKTAEADAARARQLNSQVLTFTKTETELRNQLNVYVEKFKQVEDTLNNSNDLFLTFRKEMEDMSRKTKRLEKENEAYKRKMEKLNQNILKLADERTRLLKELGDLRKKTEKLTSIINQMQQQGRGIPQGMQGMLDSCAVESHHHPEDVDHHDLGDVEDEGSTYGEEEDFDEGDQLSDDVGDYDDDTEEEILQPLQHSLPQLPGTSSTTFGPERPPLTNGHR